MVPVRIDEAVSICKAKTPQHSFHRPPTSTWCALLNRRVPRLYICSRLRQSGLEPLANLSATLEGKTEIMVGVAQEKVGGNGRLTDEKVTEIIKRMLVNPAAWMT